MIRIHTRTVLFSVVSPAQVEQHRSAPQLVSILAGVVVLEVNIPQARHISFVCELWCSDHVLPSQLRRVSIASAGVR